MQVVGAVFKVPERLVHKVQEEKVLGAAASQLKAVRQLSSGCELFILDVDAQEVMAGFEAAAEGRTKVSKAFDDEGKNFKAQVFIRRKPTSEGRLSRDECVRALEGIVDKEILFDHETVVLLSKEALQALKGCIEQKKEEGEGVKTPSETFISYASNGQVPSVEKSQIDFGFDLYNENQAGPKICMTSLSADAVDASDLSKESSNDSDSASVSSERMSGNSEDSGYMSGISSGSSASAGSTGAGSSTASSFEAMSGRNGLESINQSQGTPEAPRKALSIVAEESEANESGAKAPYLETINSCIEKFMEHVEMCMDVRTFVGLNESNQEYDLSRYSGNEANVIMRRVSDLVGNLYGSAEVNVYGSFATGLWLPGESDLDLLISLQRYRFPLPGKNRSSSNSKKEKVHGAQNSTQDAASHSVPVRNVDRKQVFTYLCSLHSALQPQPWCKNIKLINGSAMPVIKMIAANTYLPNMQGPEIPVDITFLSEGHKGLVTKELVDHLLSDLHPVLRPFVLVLKKILRKDDLHDVYTGGLGSYSLTLMAVFFLERIGFVLSDDLEEVELRNGSRLKATDTNTNPNQAEDESTVLSSGSSVTAITSSTAAIGNGITGSQSQPQHYQQERMPVCCPDKIPPVCPVLDDDASQSLLDDEIVALEEATQTVEEATAESRAWLSNRVKNRKTGPFNIGLFLMGFLRLFSRPSAGGLDLKKIEISIEKRGQIRPQNRNAVSETGTPIPTPAPLCIVDPVSDDLQFVGYGSFNMYMVQKKFGDLRKNLIDRPKDLSDVLMLAMETRQVEQQQNYWNQWGVPMYSPVMMPPPPPYGYVQPSFVPNMYGPPVPAQGPPVASGNSDTKRKEEWQQTQQQQQQQQQFPFFAAPTMMYYPHMAMPIGYPGDPRGMPGAAPSPAYSHMATQTGLVQTPDSSRSKGSEGLDSPESPMHRPFDVPEEGCTIVVRNISYEATPAVHENLVHMFEQFDKIIWRNSSARRGSLYITFATEEGARTAMAKMQDYPVINRKIKIRFYEEVKRSRSQHLHHDDPK